MGRRAIKFLQTFACILVIAAIMMLIAYGSISPCDAARNKIKSLVKANLLADEKDGNILAALVGNYAADSIASNMLLEAAEGSETPLRCAQVLWRLESGNAGKSRSSAHHSPSTNLSDSPPIIYKHIAPSLSDEMIIEKAKLCTMPLPHEEKAHEIPPYLLAAIAATESGRWHARLNIPLPWPWTVSTGGKQHYFETKQDAIVFVQKLNREPLTLNPDIYVGCMQINLKYRPKSEQDLQQVFDPSTNVAWAAVTLQDKYRQTGNWLKAVSMYDSNTGLSEQKYLALIERNKSRIAGEISSAQSARGKN